MTGVWWPSGRVLVCMISLPLYFYFQKTTFQGLSQEALNLCIQSLANAKDGITKRKVGTVLMFLFCAKHSF